MSAPALAPSVTNSQTIPAVPTQSLTLSATQFSSFATPAITVPFPSAYSQSQLPFVFTDVATFAATRIPTTIGGAAATSGISSALLAASGLTFGQSAEGGSSSSGGLPIWAIATIAGGGAAALVVLGVGLYFWCTRGARRNRKRNSSYSSHKIERKQRSRKEKDMSTEKPARYLVGAPALKTQNRGKYSRNLRGGKPRDPKSYSTHSQRARDSVHGSNKDLQYPPKSAGVAPPLGRGVSALGNGNFIDEDGNYHPLPHDHRQELDNPRNRTSNVPLVPAGFGAAAAAAGTAYSNNHPNFYPTSSSEEDGYATPDDGLMEAPHGFAMDGDSSFDSPARLLAAGSDTSGTPSSMGGSHHRAANVLGAGGALLAGGVATKRWSERQNHSQDTAIGDLSSETTQGSGGNDDYPKELYGDGDQSGTGLMSKSGSVGRRLDYGGVKGQSSSDDEDMNDGHEGDVENDSSLPPFIPQSNRSRSRSSNRPVSGGLNSVDRRSGIRDSFATGTTAVGERPYSGSSYHSAAVFQPRLGREQQRNSFVPSNPNSHPSFNAQDGDGPARRSASMPGPISAQARPASQTQRRSYIRGDQFTHDAHPALAAAAEPVAANQDEHDGYISYGPLESAD